MTTRNYLTEKSFSVEGDLLPVLAPVVKVPGASFKISKNSLFKSMTAYPRAEYQVAEVGSVRGQKLFQVTLYPAQYVGGLNEMKITRSYQVEVGKPTAQKVGDAEGIVFVVGNKFKGASSLEAYKAKKASLGLDVAQIDAGSMTAEQIRAKIKALYASKPHFKYVVVVGDSSDVPAKANSGINGITDHFYGCVDTDNYTTDIGTPDLFVGRIAVASVAQLDTVLLKYTRYIDGDFASRGWMGQASFLATNDQWELAEATHNYAIDSYTSARGYTGNFPAATQTGGDRLYAITHQADNRDVMDQIGKGRAIIDYSGHGANTFWDAPRVSQSDVRSLTHSSLPFVISNACITGDFRVAESFAETWQRHEWGAVMFWGSMDNTYWDEDDILEKKMFDGIFKAGKLAFGPIAHYALTEHARHYGGQGRSNYYWETYHMFGDPSISLRIK